VKAFAENTVTLARYRLKAGRIENSDLAAAGFDKARTLKESRRHCYARTPSSQKSGNSIMGKQQEISSSSRPCHEQPAAQSLLQTVIAVADAQLSDLDKKRVRIFQQ